MLRLGPRARSARPVIGLLLPLAVLGAACSSDGEPQTSASSITNTTGAAASSDFTLTSSAFEDGQPIPAEFTCDGANESPPLAWTDPPAGTASLALLMDDPDAPLPEPFVHWVVVGIDPALGEIAQGEVVGVQGAMGTGGTGYFGPCPPPGSPHTYHLKLYALAEEPSDDGSVPDVATIEALAADALGSTELTGTYERAG